MTKIHKYRLVLIVSVVLGLLASAAYEYLNTAQCQLSALFFVRAMLSSAVIGGGLCLTKRLLEKSKKENKLLKNKVINCLFGEKTPFYKQVLMVGGIILLLWIPYFIVSYPGNMSNDTTGQIPMFFSIFDSEKSYPVMDQHPVFTTLVFGSIVYLGNLIFNNMHIALAICIFLQMVVTAIVCAFAIVWARRKWRTSLWFSFGLVGFLTLLPLMSLMVISLSKDTFFCWVFVLFMLALIELVRGDFLLLKSKKFLLLFTALCVGVCLTKKFGIYVVSGTLVLFVIFCGQKWQMRARMAIPLAVSVGLMFVIMPFIIAKTSIVPSPTRELFSLQFQQVALTYLQHGDEMTESELERLDKVLILSSVEERYCPYNSDPIKGLADENLDAKDFIKLYVKLFFKFPDSYFNAFATQVAGLFTPYRIEPIFDNHWHTWNQGYMDEGFFEKPEFSATQSKNLKAYYDWFVGTPILNLSTFSITYVIFIPALFSICLIRRRRCNRELLISVPILISLAGLLVSPIVYAGNEAMRYIMPFVYITPTLLAYSQYLLRRKKSVDS